MLRNFAVGLVEPGTFLRLYPEQHPSGRFLKEERLWREDLYYEGNPIFEVKSFILDREGGHVTFERQPGTYGVTGGGLYDKKFPFPHAMFEIVGDDEAQRIRSRRAAAASAEHTRPTRSWWPSWLPPFAVKLAHS